MADNGRWLERLQNLARERLLLERAAVAAKAALEAELATARKDVKEQSYCWTTKDVARHFEVHSKTIDHWRKRLELPSKKLGRSVRFRPGDVRRWAAQRKEG